MKHILIVIAVLVSTVISAQTQTENYIKTTTYQTEVQEGGQSQVLEDDKIVAVNYFDGLGRVKQSVAIRAGGKTQPTNVLDWTDDWTLGTGDTPFFNMNGQSHDNERIIGENPFGEQSMLWRCGNDAASDADGGWNTDYFAVDKNLTYRYTVWVKRTGSHNGNTYHGVNNVNNLNGDPEGNPYFWYGKLPKLDTWYLMVGIVHPHTYTGGNSNISGVYDLEGNKVISRSDFKWRSTTTTARFRSYLYYATDTNVRQYFWNPVAVQLDDALQPIAQLIEASKPKDVVTHYEYDEYGRQAKEYLPYATTQTQNGAIYTDPLAELNAFYDTTKYGNTTNPYSETDFEASPLNRPLKQAAPGSEWELKTTGEDHTIKFDRRANTTADGVVYFKVRFTTVTGATGEEEQLPELIKQGQYAVNDLYVSITKDENWQTSDGKNHTTEEYTDKLGRVVLKRTFATVGSTASVPHDTYYVYDDYGNLGYVIPPKVTVEDGVSLYELANLCYQYRYDHRNRLTHKKIPGKGPETILYNKLDQPVLTQDANQRDKSSREWTFTKYDVFGRVAYTGIYTSNLPSAHLAQQINQKPLWENKSSPNGVDNTFIMYSNRAFPDTNIELHTVNYYDRYEYYQDGFSLREPVEVSNNLKGLPTNNKVRVLGTNKWVHTTQLYDTKGRVVVTASRNGYLNTSDVTEIYLDFTGRVMSTKNYHTKGNNAVIRTIDTYTYDHMGRQVKHTQKINDEATEMLSYNTYDELGQLVQKKVGNTEQAPLQSVDYKYNVRGWLTDINDVDAIGDDLFTFKINYDSPQHGGTALYNGNISETKWKTANDNRTRWYKYSYDALNRITGATDNANRYTLSNVSYDKNGNIRTLQRSGLVNNSTYGLIDNLVYSYVNDKGIDQGNRLMQVTDTGNKTYGFSEGNNLDPDYAYDANGNMTIDRNKGITDVRYNHLNLPNYIRAVETSGAPSLRGTLSYKYYATGGKQEKTFYNASNGTNTITQYAGNYIYETNYNPADVHPGTVFDYKIKFFHHPEGYVEPIYGYPYPGGTPFITGFDYVYQLKDHLGNIRLSYSDKDNDGKIDVLKNNSDVDGDGDYAHEILEEKNYYPFGLQHKGYNNTITGREHPYGYNGVEKEDELGLEWMSYEYRTSDPALGRFLQIDPKSEKYYPINPYNFTANNPILLTDPKGDTIRIYGSDEFKQQAQKDLNTLKEDKMFNKIISFLDSNKTDVNISEATSIIGAIKNFFSEGSGDEDIVKSSMTTVGADIDVEYSQINGVEVDGVESESSEVLAHELTHAFDFLGSNGNNEIGKDTEEAKRKGLSGGDRAKFIRMRGESRAVNNTNRLRSKKGKPLRNTYAGEKIIENVKSTVEPPSKQ